MSDFYFSLENDPKGGPLDDFLLDETLKFGSFFTCSHLTRIIQLHKIVIYEREREHLFVVIVTKQCGLL